MRIFFIIVLVFSALNAFAQIGLNVKSDFGISSPPNSEWSWRINHIATVPLSPNELNAGDVVAIGTYVNELTFNQTFTGTPITLYSSDLEDVFVARFSPDGKCRWAKSFGGTGLDFGRNIASAPTSNTSAIYATFTFNGRLIINGNSYNATNDDGMIICLDGNGDIVWDNAENTDQNDATYGVVANETEVFVVGGHTISSRGDGFIRGYNASNGKMNWEQPYDGVAMDIFNDIILDGNYLYVTGAISSGTYNKIPVKTIGSPNQPTGSRDLFVASVNIATRKVEWVTTVGATLTSRGFSLTKNGENIYVTGLALGDIPSFSQKNNGKYDIVLVHLKEDGSKVFAKLFGSANDDSGLKIAATTNSYVLSASITGDVVLGKKVYENKSLKDILMINFDDKTTNPYSALVLNSINSFNDFGDALCKIPGQDSLYFFGTFGQKLIFQDTVLVEGKSAGANGFMMKVNSRGSVSVPEYLASNISAFSAYPNPANHTAIIGITSEIPQDVELSVIDALGRTIRNENISIQEGSNQIQLSLENIVSGLYILNIKGKTGQSALKLRVE